jgi:predicted permease
MPLLPRLRSLWRNLLHRDTVERDLDDELRATLELLVDEKVASGLAAAEARRQAMIELGGVEQVKERVRNVRIGNLIETAVQDLKYAWRHLRRSLGFSIAAVLTLALGIGANTAMFSMLNALLLRPLAIKDPHGLVSLSTYNERGKRYLPMTVALDLSKYGPFEIVCGHNSGFTFPVSANGIPTLAATAFVSGSCFELFGVMPVLGRVIDHHDAPLVTAGRKVVVISDRLWNRLYGRDPAVIGKVLVTGSTEATVVGVMPATFKGIEADQGVDVFAPPDSISPAAAERRPVASEILGRLRPGVTFEQAAVEMDARWPAYRAQLLEQTRNAQEGANLIGVTIRLEHLALGLSSARARYSPTICMILGLTVLLLLLACVNLGGLLLTRLTARGAELGIRLALGGSRWRIAQQMLAESLLLSLAGSVLAVPVALAFIEPLTAFLPTGFIDRAMSFRPDVRVLVATATAGLVVGVLMTALPIWFALRRPASIRFSWDRTIAGTTGRWSQTLLITQVALSVVVLVNAALLARSLYLLKHAPLGIRTEGVLSAKLMPLPGPGPAAVTGNYYRSMVERLAAEPGIQSAGLSAMFPRGAANAPSAVAFAGADFDGLDAAVDHVSPGFFETLQVPLLRGRLAEWSDDVTAQRVAVVSASLARALLPEGDVLERRIRVGTLRDAQDIRIIGIVGDATRGDPRDPAPRVLYLAAQQLKGLNAPNITLATSSPSAAAAAIRRVVAEGGREYPPRIISLDEWFDMVSSRERMGATIASVVGGLAVLLALIGIHGVLAYSVSRRTREIGVRVAMGADPSMVGRAVIREGFAVTLAGVAIGLPAAHFASQLLRSLLFGISEGDALTFVVTAAFFVVLGTFAGVLPARKAATVDPVIALRAD